MKKICVNCLTKIIKGEHYFEVIEFKDNKRIGKRWVHKVCQDKVQENINSQVELNEKAKQFITNANQLMKNKFGMEEVVVLG